ncbi:stereocilin-like isoform X2 [Pseudoliparis swirei]|uniref:stereocilin-like isoform X2 n=1 Tax=Pseudoliparis swirei TaxID=2059687 RepID=UPI0024BE852D|nr:stereocilin-like isoform X2 [Pseudoliparis swirei]
MMYLPTYLLLHLPPGKVGDLPDSVCPVFLDKMQEADLSSLPRRLPSRPALTRRALRCLAEGPNLSGLTVEDVSSLGLLLCELQASQLLRMSFDVLKFSLEQMASCQHIPQRHRAEIIQLVKSTFGDSSSWSPEMMEALGPFVLLDDNSTSALPNKPWMKDVLYSLTSGQQYTSNALRKKIFHLTTSSNAAGRNKGSDIVQETGDAFIQCTFLFLTCICVPLFSLPATRSVDEELSVQLIEELGMNNVYWTHTQLAGMSNEIFLTTLETLGAVCDYGDDQLAELSKKAVEVLGPVSQMTESVVMQLGCITRGFSDADLEELPFSRDALEDIEKCGWNTSQREAVWRGVAQHENLKAQQLEAADMVALRQFICGLNSSEFRQLNVDAFKDAVGSLNDFHCCPRGAQQLKRLAVSAFGNPNTWTEAHVSELGYIIIGLNSSELASLDSAVFSFIGECCIPLILHFDVLSVAQLEALGPDNAAMVTSEQQASLSDEQLAALERAVIGSPDLTQRAELSGSPSLNVEGISALVKPFLLLLMGFLLL